MTKITLSYNANMKRISNTQISNVEHKKLRTRTPLDENKKLELKAIFAEIEKRLDEIAKRHSENMDIFEKGLDDFGKRLLDD